MVSKFCRRRKIATAAMRKSIRFLFNKPCSLNYFIYFIKNKFVFFFNKIHFSGPFLNSNTLHTACILNRSTFMEQKQEYTVHNQVQTCGLHLCDFTIKSHLAKFTWWYSHFKHRNIDNSSWRQCGNINFNDVQCDSVGTISNDSRTNANAGQHYVNPWMILFEMNNERYLVAFTCLCRTET